MHRQRATGHVGHDGIHKLIPALGCHGLPNLELTSDEGRVSETACVRDERFKLGVGLKDGLAAGGTELRGSTIRIYEEEGNPQIFPGGSV